MENVDCLICHDTTGKYSKKKNICGYPDEGIDLTEIAEKVGLPGRKNCGSCHFYGGGGDNAKHGDLSSELIHPSPGFDVHMGEQDFTCQKCHVTENHRIAGSSTTSSVSEGSISCTDCHDANPHDASSPLLKKLNEHITALSCQACHIPMFARNRSTLTYRDGTKLSKKTKLLAKSENRVEMITKNGLLVKEKKLRPSYAWYNGKHHRYIKGQKVQMDGLTALNKPDGNISDAGARITPYKIIRSRQMADADNRYLIVPHLTGNDGLFATLNRKMSAEKGMKAAGLPFSGNIAYAETMMFWRLNHGVVPKEKALSCLDCHREDGVMDFKALGYAGDPSKTGRRLQD